MAAAPAASTAGLFGAGPSAVSVLERPSVAPDPAIDGEPGSSVDVADGEATASRPTRTRAPRRNLRRIAGLLPTVVSVLLVVAMWIWVAGGSRSDAEEASPAVEPGATVDTVPGPADAGRDAPSTTGDFAPDSDGRAGAPGADPGPLTRSPTQGPVASPASWYPVVEVLDGESTDRAAAAARAQAVTALGYPATALASDDVDGLEPGDWVLVGEPRDSLDARWHPARA